MWLFPPLLYWSCGSGQCSKVSTALKPSRKLIRGRWWPEVGVKAWLLLGRSFWEVFSNVTSNLGQCKTSQDRKLQSGTSSLRATPHGRQFSIFLIVILLRQINKELFTSKSRNQYMPGRPWSQCSLLAWTFPHWIWEACSGWRDVLQVTCPSLLEFLTSAVQSFKKTPKTPTHHTVLFCLGHDSEGGFSMC